jgi:hypothetical protein
MQPEKILERARGAMLKNQRVGQAVFERSSNRSKISRARVPAPHSFVTSLNIREKWFAQKQLSQAG